MALLRLLLPVALLSATTAVPIQENVACSSYTIINTRGTGELPGESTGFRAVNADLLAQLPSGKRYNTVYPADMSQNSRAGTQDIVQHIAKTLQSSPKECFVLEGYSQGAAATVNALSSLPDSSASAVKGVLLIGNPEHKSGLRCNVDMTGGTSTKNVNGMQSAMNSIRDVWIPKTLDVCNFGDGVCDTTHGMGINAQHLAYPNDQKFAKMGTEFLLKKLRAGGIKVESGGSQHSEASTVQDGVQPAQQSVNSPTQQPAAQWLTWWKWP